MNITVEVKTIAKVIEAGPVEVWACVEADGGELEALFETEDDVTNWIDSQGYDSKEYRGVLVMITAATPKTVK